VLLRMDTISTRSYVKFRKSANASLQ